jgi:hypothetical protein
MNRWSQRFESHTSNVLLKQLLEHVKKLENEEILDENIASELGRLLKAIEYLNSITNIVDPDLIGIQALNEIQNPMQQTVNEISQFITNKNIGHITNANDNFDNVLYHISKYFILPKTKVTASIPKILGVYQDQTEKFVKKIEADSERVNKSTNTDLDAFKAEADQKITALETEKATLAKEVASLNGILAGIKTEANDHKANLEKQFMEAISAEQKKSETMLEAAQNNIDKSFGILAKKGNTAISIMDKLREDSEIVFGVVQNTAQAGAHKNYADQEKKTANFYRTLATSLMILSVIFVLWPILSQIKGLDIPTPDIDLMLKRAALSLIILAPAFYLARESGQHRKNEFKNRRTELTLRTIEPYLALMSDETQKEQLKAKVAESIFSEQAMTSSKDETSLILSQVQKMISSVTKIAGK